LFQSMVVPPVTGLSLVTRTIWMY